MEKREIRSVEGWRGNTMELSLENADLDLVDSVLCLVPELRLVARFGQEARRRGFTYPIDSPKQLADLWRRQTFKLGDYRVDAKSITHAMAEEWFPLVHEGELLSAIHLALRRCQAEDAAAIFERQQKPKRGRR